MVEEQKFPLTAACCGTAVCRCQPGARHGTARQGEEPGSAKPGSAKPGSAKPVPRHAALVSHSVSMQWRAGSIPGAWLSRLCGVWPPPQFWDPPFFGVSEAAEQNQGGLVGQEELGHQHILSP